MCSNFSQNFVQIFYRAVTVVGGNADVYRDCFASCFERMRDRYEKGEIQAICDADKEFIGMEGIIKGIEVRYAFLILKVFSKIKYYYFTEKLDKTEEYYLILKQAQTLLFLSL